jgi:hypothetical protein
VKKKKTLKISPANDWERTPVIFSPKAIFTASFFAGGSLVIFSLKASQTPSLLKKFSIQDNSVETWFFTFRYNVPRSFLKPKGNLLVLLEEEKGYPLGIFLDTISITKVCGLVSGSYLPSVTSWRRQEGSGKIYQKKPGRRPKLQLHCPPKRIISKILFASFGTPSGDCESYDIGRCHSSNSRDIVEKVSFLFCNIFPFFFNIFQIPCKVSITRDFFYVPPILVINGKVYSIAQKMGEICK